MDGYIDKSTLNSGRFQHTSLNNWQISQAKTSVRTGHSWRMPLRSLIYWSPLKPCIQLQKTYSSEAHMETDQPLDHRTGHKKMSKKNFWNFLKNDMGRFLYDGINWKYIYICRTVIIKIITTRTVTKKKKSH